jgi:2,3-bisphosphoglycerate-independent phosphoglycerate mutase
MKYVVIIPDGAADEPQEFLDGRTPLEAADIPAMDALARRGRTGLSWNVPSSLAPGSDVANLSLLGYDPLSVFTGRAPLEAAAQGIAMGENDWAFRCNLVTLDGDTMVDFTAGHVSTEEATELLASLQEVVGSQYEGLEFHPGVSYRNLLIDRRRQADTARYDQTTATFAPHDYTGKSWLPGKARGAGADFLETLMQVTSEVFTDHPVNRRRLEEGKLPVTQAWLWGQGRRPSLERFEKKYGAGPGAMITAVDLLRGIARLIDWNILDVPGATGYLDTDYAAKGRAAIEALSSHDVVCVHVEAPDEASHEGKLKEKMEAIEAIDEKIVAPVTDALQGESDWRLLVSPDHPTPIRTQTHSHDPVPWILAGSDIAPGSAKHYGEAEATRSGERFEAGWKLVGRFLHREASH